MAAERPQGKAPMFPLLSLASARLQASCCQNGTFQEEVRLEKHRLGSNLVARQERVCFPVMPYSSQGSLDIFTCELLALLYMAPLCSFPFGHRDSAGASFVDDTGRRCNDKAWPKA